jgi:hypothetical protein
MNVKAGALRRTLNTLFTCKRYRHCLAKGLIALLVVVLLTPVGREWTLYLLTGGKMTEPKGWPWAEPWRDWDKPTDPRELTAYEYAHSLKLPDSLPKPVPFDFNRHLLSDRRATAAAYFDHLCKTEAGEFIFRTVDKVEGLYQMRAMPRRSDKVLRDRYGFEDPADWSSLEANEGPLVFIGGPENGFRYFESSTPPNNIANRVSAEKWEAANWIKPSAMLFWHYHQYDHTNNKGQVQPLARLESHYAYTWRGIQRERDREFGIAGGELIVLDHVTGEILGVRRSFAIAKYYPTHLDWEFAHSCPDTLRADGKVRISKFDASYPFSFIFQILKPIDIDPLKMRFN